MSEFQEDMIFKNVNEEEELDPTTFVPDIILELDEEIRIIELQSVKVHKVHHKRFHVYLAMADLKFDKFGKKSLCLFFQQRRNLKKLDSM